MISSLDYECDDIKNARAELQEYAEPLCKDVPETSLPPLRAVNHQIPLINENKIYPWRPSRCPEAFRAQWVEKTRCVLEIWTMGNDLFWQYNSYVTHSQTKD